MSVLRQPGFSLCDRAAPPWMLVRGEVELYAQPHRDGKALGPRRFLGALTAGAVLPRLPQHAHWRIRVVPLGGDDLERFVWPGGNDDEIPPLEPDFADSVAARFAPLSDVFGAPAPAPLAGLLMQPGAAAALHQWLLACMDAMSEGQVAADVVDSMPANREACRSALLKMVTVVDPQARPEPAVDNSLVSLACEVARAQGISLPDGADRADAGISLEQWAMRANLRLRRVAMRDNWWERSGVPLLATLKEGQAPVALLPQPHGGYLWRGPEGELKPVTAEAANGLSHFAHSFHGRLPDSALALADLLRFGWRGAFGDIGIMLLASLVAGAVGALTPAAVAYVFQTVIPSSEPSLLSCFALLLVVFALARGVLKLTGDLASLRIEGRLGNGLQSAFFDRLLRLPLAFYTGMTSGDLSNRLTTVDMVRRSFANLIVTASTSLFYTAGAFATMAYYMPKAALISGLVMLGVWAVSGYFGWRQIKALYEGEQFEGNMIAMAVQLIQGIPKLRLAGAEDRAFGRWGRGYAEMRMRITNSKKLQVNYTVVVAMAEVALSATVFAVLGYADGEKPTTSEFLALVAALATFSASGLSMGQAVVTAISMRPYFERVRPIMNAIPDAPAAAEGGKPLNGGLEVIQLSFAYARSSPAVLQNLSFSVRPGEFVAVVGASGSGKSTLMRLLLGFERPSSGGIYYDGADLFSLNPASVRRQIGVVLQNGRTMPGTLFENISLAHPCTHDEVWEAARLAGLDDDIRAMPMGMHTVLSEGNATLSGGQVQRLLLARALAGKPRLLLLDEATSALDNRTQACITDALKAMAATRIVIAHRLSTVMGADQILVLHEGRLVERGRYHELLAQDGHFARLVRRQLL